jgi:CO dehydrogenase/acetyl-CoA synthase gamma subunit (corrinoid Fe-S protein)
MPLSVVDLYRDILPKTNCGDCGLPNCMACAGMVVSEKHPLTDCPHIAPHLIEKCQRELDEQYAKDSIIITRKNIMKK